MPIAGPKSFKAWAVTAEINIARDESRHNYARNVLFVTACAELAEATAPLPIELIRWLKGHVRDGSLGLLNNIPLRRDDGRLFPSRP